MIAELLNCPHITIWAIGLSVLSIVINLILIVYIIFFPIKKDEIRQGLKLSWLYRHTVFHILAFLLLTCYVLFHWNACVNMQLFSQFNGNNILFIIWLASAFLIIYDVEGKGFKVAKHKREESQNQYETIKKQYALESMKIANQNIIANDPNKIRKGDNKNGS